MKDAACFPDERDVAGAGRDARDTRDTPCACLRPWNGLCPEGKHGLDYAGQACDLCPPSRTTSQITIVLTVEHAAADTSLERAVQRALDRAAEVLDLDLEARDVELVALRVGTVAYGAGGGK